MAAVLGAAGIIFLTLNVGLAHNLLSLESPGNPLLDFGRNRLAMCIQPLAGAATDPEAVRAAIQGAVASLSQRPAWSEMQLDRQPVVVDQTCPKQPALPGPGPVPRDPFETAIDRTLNVDSASPYGVFIWVMPEAHLRTLFGGRLDTPRTATEERVCPSGQRRQCETSTVGLYVADSEVGDQARVERLLASAIAASLLPPPSPEPGNGITSKPAVRPQTRPSNLGQPPAYVPTTVASPSPLPSPEQNATTPR